MKNKPIKKRTPDEQLSKLASKDLLPKNRTWSQFIEENAFKLYDYAGSFIPRLINTLYHWVETENPLHIGQFCKAYKISYNALYDLAEKHPDLKRAITDVKVIIAMNRFEGVVHNQLNERVIMKSQHMYDPEMDDVNKYWQAMNIERAAVKQDNSVGSLTVMLNQAPDLDALKQIPTELKENDETI